MSDLGPDSQNKNEADSEVILADTIKLTLIIGEGDQGKFPVLKFEFIDGAQRKVLTEIRYLAFVEDLMTLSNLIAKCGFQASKEGCS